MKEKELRTMFGRNIKAYRNRRNWSQAELAASADISINFLGDIERGKKWPHPDTLAKLADALEIKVFELFIEDDRAVDLDTHALMTRVLSDFSLIINKSLSSSVNQSIEYIRKQYKLP